MLAALQQAKGSGELEGGPPDQIVQLWEQLTLSLVDFGVMPQQLGEAVAKSIRERVDSRKDPVVEAQKCYKDASGKLRQVGNRKVVLEQKQRQAEEALREATHRMEEIQQELDGAIAELNAATHAYQEQVLQTSLGRAKLAMPDEAGMDPEVLGPAQLLEAMGRLDHSLDPDQKQQLQGLLDSRIRGTKRDWEELEDMEEDGVPTAGADQPLPGL